MEHRFTDQETTILHFFVWPYTGAFLTQRMHTTGLGITELPHEQMNNTANTNVLLDNTREFFVNIQLPSPHKDIHLDISLMKHYLLCN